MAKKQSNMDFWDIAAAIMFLFYAFGAGIVSRCKDMGDSIKQKFQHSRQR